MIERNTIKFNGFSQRQSTIVAKLPKGANMSIFNHDGTVSYEGCVLALGEMNYYDDSDFYAVIYDKEKNEIRRVMYDTTRFGGGGNAKVDATEEVIKKASKILYEKYLEAWNSWNISQAKKPRLGNTVIVKAGRKVPINTVGILFYIGQEKKFSPSRWAAVTQSAGIALDNEQDDRGRYKNVAWTYLHNLEVINPEQNLAPEHEGHSYAKVNQTNWRGFTYAGLPIL